MISREEDLAKAVEFALADYMAIEGMRFPTNEYPDLAVAFAHLVESLTPLDDDADAQTTRVVGALVNFHKALYRVARLGGE